MTYKIKIIVQIFLGKSVKTGGFNKDLVQNVIKWSAWVIVKLTNCLF